MRAKFDWEEHYEAAVLENDDKKLPNRLQAAKSWIIRRTEKLDHGGTPEEWQSIAKALQNLNVLERERKTCPYEVGSSSA